jgi:heptosyltransferase-3
MGYPHIASLAEAGGLVDAVRYIEAPALAPFFAPGTVLSVDLAEYFAGFALIISYLYDPDHVFQINIRRCSRAQFIAGPHRINEQLAIHATDCLLQPLQRLAIFSPDAVPRLPLRSQQPAASLPLLALHPGSGSEEKNWPEHKWAELLAVLSREQNLQFLLVGGEVEGDRLDRLAGALPAHRTELARNLPLPDLARCLVRASFFIGHDSGISHLAAAVGLPGLILWGATREEIWRPRSSQMRIVRDPVGLASLGVQHVLEQLRTWLAELSCHSIIPGHHHL